MGPLAILACALVLTGAPVAAAPQDGPPPAGVAAAPDGAPSPAALQRGLAGRWTGALGYRDYQTDELFEIPVSTKIVQVPDGLTQVRTSLFDDGPAKPVWITTTSLQDETAGTVASVSVRAGRPIEVEVESVRLAEWRDDTHWTLIYDRTGEDDDQPADIRVTESRDGDRLLSVKTVRPVGADDSAWHFRNQTRLTRTGD